MDNQAKESTSSLILFWLKLRIVKNVDWLQNQGRITRKGYMREWNNARGSGKFFSFTIADETSDLKVTSFKEEAEKFYSMVEKGKVYQITNGTLKGKNAKFNNTDHDFELTLNRMSLLEECPDDGFGFDTWGAAY